MKKDAKQLLFERMSYVNPDFKEKINEDWDGENLGSDNQYYMDRTKHLNKDAINNPELRKFIGTPIRVKFRENQPFFETKIAGFKWDEKMEHIMLIYSENIPELGNRFASYYDVGGQFLYKAYVDKNTKDILTKIAYTLTPEKERGYIGSVNRFENSLTNLIVVND